MRTPPGQTRVAFSLFQLRGVRGRSRRGNHVQEDPDRQPGRDRLPRHQDRAQAWASRPSRSIPTPTATRCMCAMADEAVHIGPSPAAQSYIVIDKIMDAMRRPGAEAVHPGYGFLSENARLRRGAGGGGRRLHRPARPRDRGDGRQDHLEEARAGGGRLHRAGLHGPDRRCRRGGEDRRRRSAIR